MSQVYKPLTGEADSRESTTQVSVQVSGVLPQDVGNGGQNSQKFPAGYTSPNFTWFTFTTASQYVDINWGIRSGCFDDSTSMFYNSDSTYGGENPAPFTGLGAHSVSKTASMVYKSISTAVNNGEDFVFDSDTVDLLGVLNFKRSQYRDRIQPGSFKLNFRSSGSAYVGTYDALTDNGATNIGNSFGGTYSDIINGSVKIGRLYHDEGIALLDLFKTFFPSSDDRDVANRSDLLPFITGSTGLGSINAIHGIGFFSGSAFGGSSTEATKRSTYRSADPADILSFYSASYSQSLNTLTRDLSGCSFNGQVNFSTKTYFCRAFSNEYNYSNNLTFGTGSNKVYRLSEPQTFITTVGLYNEADMLLAVGKLSQPLKKDFGRESVIRVRLDF